MSLDDIIDEGERKPLRESDGRVILSIPFAQKDNVKRIQAGARWDPQKKNWYVPATRNPLPYKQWWALPPLLRLEGEDLNFGGSHLFVDLIPTNCWFTNVRYCISEADWFRLRTFVYGRASHLCEICGNDTGGLEAHERWEYDQELKVQKLRRLICLCHACHQATHIGLAQVRGKGLDAEKHIQKVNGWSKNDVEHHVEDAFETWEKRNIISWKLDISVLENTGIKAIRPIKDQDRKSIAYMSYRSSNAEASDESYDATDLSEDEHF